jgi:hypothetical protein
MRKCPHFPVFETDGKVKIKAKKLIYFGIFLEILKFNKN